ncbi:MAG: MFS transporter [Bacteroidota bacterium]
MKSRTLPVFLAFLVMGFGDAVGPFVGLAKNNFHLTNIEAQFIAFMGFIMFGILSVPMGLVQDKKGKKFILLSGLTVALLGLLIPIFGLSSYALFLLTVLLLGAGATILQVAGNPIMRDVSPPGKYSRNLSLGQFIKAIGSLSGPVIPALAAAWFASSWEILFPIYSIAIFITILFVSTMKVEEQKKENAPPASFSSCFALLKNKFVLMMVIAIFVYVGAEVCMSAGIPLYLEKTFGVDISTLGILGTGLFFLALMTGRFLGSIILDKLSPQRFFIITSLLSVIGILGLFTGIQSIAVISMFVIGLGFANIFPLVFSITVDAMPERTNELSGLMVTAIVGGAILPLLMGAVADAVNVVAGFIVPLSALVYITIVSLRSPRRA